MGWIRGDRHGLATTRPSRSSAGPFPPSTSSFSESFVDTCRFGDYLFVHAGIRPGGRARPAAASPICAGSASRSCSTKAITALSSSTDTPSPPGLDERPNRIGIDTGAYRTGVLTALAIEDSERWYLDTAAVGTAAFCDALIWSDLDFSQRRSGKLSNMGRLRVFWRGGMVRIDLSPTLSPAPPGRQLFLLGGCADSPAGRSRTIVRSAIRTPRRSRRLVSDYRIAPMDKLSVKVFKSHDLSGDYEVDLTGNISLPLVGEVEPRTSPPPQLDQRLTQKLGKKYLEHPDVSVGIKESIRRSVTVDGAVKQAGTFPMAGPTSLMQAVALAGARARTPMRAGSPYSGPSADTGQAAAFDLTAIRHGQARSANLSGRHRRRRRFRDQGDFRADLADLPLLSDFQAVLAPNARQHVNNSIAVPNQGRGRLAPIAGPPPCQPGQRTYSTADPRLADPRSNHSALALADSRGGRARACRGDHLHLVDDAGLSRVGDARGQSADG